MSRVFLIGYRGTGKSTVARHLAELLGWTALDADAVLEHTYGTTIKEIFATEGEPSFRDKESTILAELATRDEVVIATGGGVILRPENRELLRHGKVAWLQASPQTIADRLARDATTEERRPDLAQGGLAEIIELLKAREPLYKACAGFEVDTEKYKPREAAKRIYDWLYQPG